MLQLHPVYSLWNRRKTLTGSPDPTRANGTNKPCISNDHLVIISLYEYLITLVCEGWDPHLAEEPFLRVKVVTSRGPTTSLSDNKILKYTWLTSPTWYSPLCNQLRLKSVTSRALSDAGIPATIATRCLFTSNLDDYSIFPMSNEIC